MPTDDLDFFLLDIVSNGSHGLPVFDIDIANLGECLNCRVPHFTRPELIAALVELHEAGDIEAILKQPRERQLTFQPNGSEIDAGISGALRMSYRLTPKGGERWRRIVGLDWNLWEHDNWLSTNFGSITTGDREFAEFLFEREVRQGNVRKLVALKEVRPWKPVNWHEEPVGYQVHYRSKRSEEQTQGPRFPPDWFLVPIEPGPAPVLSPRRNRPAAPEVRRFEALAEKQLESRLNHRSVLTRLAAATELGRRPGSTPLLIELLRRWCPAVRFAAARALGQRRATEAVPALLGAVFGYQDVAAAEALGSIGDSRALGPLLNIFEWWRGWRSFPEPKFFEAVERAVVQYGDKAVTRLEKLARKSPGLQNRVLSALGHSSSERAVQILIGQMPEHFDQVADLLSRMSDAARAHIFNIATNEKQASRFRETAARALAEYPGAFQEEARTIAETLRQCRARTFLQKRIALAVTGDAEKAVDDSIRELTALLRHPSCAKRRAAVDCLGQLGAEGAAADIARLSHDERWEVRASVARLLARWGKPAEALDSLRHDSDIIVRGYARGFN